MNGTWLKAVGNGLLWTITAAFLLNIFGLSALFFMPRPGNDVALGWDPVSFWKSPLPWMVVAIAFVAGFAWKYRKETSRAIADR